MSDAGFLINVNEMADIEAERAIIEIIIDDALPATQQRAMAVSSLASVDFADAQTRVCFEAIEFLVTAGKPVDHLSVSAELRRRKCQFQSVSIRSSLLSVKDNLQHYIDVVQRESCKRQLMGVAQSISSSVPLDDVPTIDMVARFEADVRQCAPRGVGDPNAMHKLVEGAIIDLVARGKAGNKLVGLSTGLDDLDWMTQGLQPDNLVVIGSRPGMGKTSLAMQFAVEMATTGSPVLVASLEMSAKQLIGRTLSNMSRVSYNKIRNAYMTSWDWDSVGEAALKMADLPIIIEDATYQTTADIRARATRMANVGGIGAIIVDYLQIIEPINRTNNPVIDVGNISRELKRIANEFHVPVIALAQLSRNLEHRADKRPLLSDLRETGRIEADADTVMFIYRDSYYKRNEHRPNEMEQAEIIVAKQRDGQTGKSVVGFWPELMRFDNIDNRYE